MEGVGQRRMIDWIKTGKREFGLENDTSNREE